MACSTRTRSIAAVVKVGCYLCALVELSVEWVATLVGSNSVSSSHAWLPSQVQDDWWKLMKLTFVL